MRIVEKIREVVRTANEKVKETAIKVHAKCYEKLIESKHYACNALKEDYGINELFAVLGVGMIVVLLIVITWGIVSGWLPAFLNKILGKLDSIG